MCRVLFYIGEESVSLYDMLFLPDNSLIKQSWNPKMMSGIQNLAGFGLCAWDKGSPNREIPYFYKTSNLPFFDSNLYHLSKKIVANTLLSHVRGVDYSVEETITRQNTHPFLFPNHKIALAHNGSLADMDLMKPEMIKYLPHEVVKNIKGSTDSEWIYALLVSKIKEPTKTISLDEAREAVIKTLQILREIRVKLHISKSSPVNLYITNGDYALITRFVYDFGINIERVEKYFLEYHSQWLTFGQKCGFDEGAYKLKNPRKMSNVIVASEPLTEDKKSWIEVPEYNLSTIWHEQDGYHLHLMDLNL